MVSSTAPSVAGCVLTSSVKVPVRPSPTPGTVRATVPPSVPAKPPALAPVPVVAGRRGDVAREHPHHGATAGGDRLLEGEVAGEPLAAYEEADRGAVDAEV